MEDGNFTRKVHGRLSSRFNFVAITPRLSKGVREIRKRLDAIAQNHNQFGFKSSFQPTYGRREEGLSREETYSFVNAESIIGRGVDLEKIVGRLLDGDVQQDVSCLTIVGMGGLGKTTLAQLLYNDPRIEREFPLRLWACIFDKNGWNLKAILRKIMQSAPEIHSKGDYSLEDLQKQLREILVGNKYMLVLDDVWNEDRGKWTKLMDLLMGAEKGSWIIVTTRSRITATSIGGEVHNLRELSKEDAWRLFEKVAFAGDLEQTSRLELSQVGREIVEQCANVPLAIKVVGAALHGQDKKKWQSFQVNGFRVMPERYGIGSILKLSYLHLDPQLRICLRYCALFPKDFEIQKEILINLWIAQGYIIPHGEVQSIEDAGEEYFMLLLKRCFFQEVCIDDYGEIISFKMHDLMHDIAQEVSGKEIVQVNLASTKLNNKVRHLFRDSWEQGTKSLLDNSNIRTYLGNNHWGLESPKELGRLLAKWRSLRALDISHSKLENLPSTLGKLLHLRYLNLFENAQLKVLPSSITKLKNLQVLYLPQCRRLTELPKGLAKLTNLRVLDLSHNKKLEVLPNSIIKLHNLQILFLTGCKKLQGLPRELSNLTKLKVLDTTDCESLSHMPMGMGKLSHLSKLPFFVISQETTLYEGRGRIADQAQEITTLQNLKGSLHVQMNANIYAKYEAQNSGNGSHLSPHLTKFLITFPERYSWERRVYEIDEALLENLQPHANLLELELENYHGLTMPTWAREGNLVSFLPNLVSIRLRNCHKLQQLPVVRKLPRLKFLVVLRSDDLEFVENNTTHSMNGSDSSRQVFFPSLERLELSHLCKLKAWWSQELNGGSLPAFNSLSHLQISYCTALVSIPLSSEATRMWPCIGGQSLRFLTLISLPKLKRLPNGMRSLAALQSLKIERCMELESMPEWMSELASLEQLHIIRCSDALQERCHNDTGEDWSYIQHVPDIRIL